MGMGFAPTWLRQVSHPLLHKTTLTTDYHAEFGGSRSTNRVSISRGKLTKFGSAAL